MLGMLGIYIASIGYNTGWWLVLVRTLYFLPFWGGGILYRHVLEKYDCLSNTVYFAIVFSIQLCVILYYGFAPSYAAAWCADFVNGPVMPIIVGFTGIAFWLRVSKILEPAVGRSRVINTIADNAYSIMIHQIIGFMALKTVFALLCKYTPFFHGFDFVRYKTDIWYYYFPKEVPHTAVLYLAAGITIPLLIAAGQHKVIQFFTRRTDCHICKREKNEMN